MDMSFSVGIVGLPNVGKSTLFKILTKNPVNIDSYPFTTINPNIGVVTVPDERLERIADLVKPEKTTPTIIEFIDIAGLVKNAHQGEGMGNQFLSFIRNCDALVEVVRGFSNTKVENVLGEVNPQREIGIVKTEFLMKDLEILDNLISKIEKKNDKEAIRKIGILKKIKEEISEGKLISEINLSDNEYEEIKEYQFLTSKPVIYVLNIDKDFKASEYNFEHLKMNLKDEEDITELSPEETEAFGLISQIDKLITACYNILNLITFYTIVGLKEARAWTLKKGDSVLGAAGVVHSDFKEKFIRAEVIQWQKLIEAGSWSEAKNKGWIQTVGKDYLVKNGDVIEFKI